MNALSDLEGDKIISIAKKIYTYILMQSKAFEILAKKTKEEKIKQLLLSISSDETNHSKLWFEEINKFEDLHYGKFKTVLRNWKISFMMHILGTKSFIEWVIVGEEEALYNLAVQVENVKDAPISEFWGRMYSDEQFHLDRMKDEILGIKSWEIAEGGGISDMILGANDGLVSTLAFIAGVFGAIAQSYVILLSGIAELFAGTISMGVGAYQSSKSELEVLERENRRKKIKKKKTLKEQKEELIKLYQEEGFEKNEAKAIANKIVSKEDRFLHEEALQKLGLTSKERGNPAKAGILCGISFALAALVPIFPFIFPLSSIEAMIFSIIATNIALFSVGAMKTIFSRKNWILSGLQMMIIGAAAAGITYIIGIVFSLIF